MCCTFSDVMTESLPMCTLMLEWLSPVLPFCRSNRLSSVRDVSESTALLRGQQQWQIALSITNRSQKA